LYRHLGYHYYVVFSLSVTVAERLHNTRANSRSFNHCRCRQINRSVPPFRTSVALPFGVALLVVIVSCCQSQLYASEIQTVYPLRSTGQNLLTNPLTAGLSPDSSQSQDIPAHDAPIGWQKGDGETIHDSVLFFQPSPVDSAGTIGITGGTDRQGVWQTPIEPCKPGRKYLFTAQFYRSQNALDGSYPEISLWGERTLLNTHWQTGRYQPLFAYQVCPEHTPDGDRMFKFINYYPGTTFQMRYPQLTLVETVAPTSNPEPDNDFFAIGAFGATAENLVEIKKIGFNSAVIGLNEESVAACIENNLHCTLNVPRQLDELAVKLEPVADKITTNRFAFYVNDEPGIHSFPVGRAIEIQRYLKKRFPGHFTTMAIVRPQVISAYQDGADYFMLDQYPVPNMPMTWLSDSIDTGADQVGSDRLQAVVQAFGGSGSAKHGWPRLPGFEEMNNLAYLAIIHGVRGLYFFTYPVITAADQGKKDISLLTRRLNGMRSWLSQKNDPEPVHLKMISKYRYDPQGRPGVHCTSKEQHHTKMLICANTLSTYVEAAIDSPRPGSLLWQDYFTGDRYHASLDTLYHRFAPLEVLVLIEQ
ncbi:hypothetical protein, partial [Desulforhopalus singaporensis]